jgi:hypothetical protein
MSGQSLRVRRYALGLLPFAALALARLSVFAEGDTFWGVRSGQQIVARHSVHLHDTLSWTRAGAPWHPNEWGYDVVLWLAYRLDGIVGLQLLVAATVMVLGVVLLAAVRAFHGSVRDVYWVSLFCGPLLLGWLSARAQTVSYSFQLLALLVLAQLFTARGRAVFGWAAVLLGLQFVWVNLHEAAVSGVAVAVGSAAVRGVSVIRRGGLNQRSAARLLAGPAIVLVGSLGGPFGWSVFADSAHTRAASTGYIAEWAAIWHTTPTVLVQAGVAFVLLLVVGHVWRRERGTALEGLADVWLGAALVLAAASVVVVRFVAPLLLVDIVALVAAVRTGRPRTAVSTHRRLLTVAATAVAVALAATGVRQLARSGEPTSGNFPSVRLVDAIPSDCRLLNQYGDGGWISLLRGPAVRVSQDGRNYLYGRALLHRENELLAGRQGTAGLARFGASCVLANPTSGIAQELSHDPDWAVAGEDSQRILYLRQR